MNISKGTIATICASITTLIGIVTCSTNNNEITSDNKSEAWEIVTKPYRGNSNKKWALEHLHRISEELVNLDLSCQYMGGRTYEAEGQIINCKPQTYLKDLILVDADLQGSNFEFSNLENANFSHSKISGATFKGANLKKSKFVKSNAYPADFSLSDLSYSDFKNSMVTFSFFRKSKLEGANFANSNLTNTSFEEANIYGADFTNSFLMNTNFTGTVGISSANFTGSWAYEQSPPIGLPAGTVELCMFDSRSRHISNEGLTKPTPCTSRKAPNPAKSELPPPK